MDRFFELSDVWPHLDLKTLFRLHWGGKGVKDEAWEELLRDEFLPRLRAMQEEVEQTGWMQPRVRYGYFPANRDGNDLIVFIPDDAEREIAGSPSRASRAGNDSAWPTTSCRSIQDGEDVAVFQIVTVGAERDRANRKAASGRTSTARASSPTA